MNIIYNYIPANVKEPQWFKFYNTEEFVVTTQRDYTTRAASSLDLIPEPKCFTQEFLSKFGDMDDMMLKKKKEIENDWEEILFDFIDFYPCILPHELFEWLEENYEIPKKKDGKD